MFIFSVKIAVKIAEEAYEEGSASTYPEPKVIYKSSWLSRSPFSYPKGERDFFQLLFKIKISNFGEDSSNQ